MTTPTQIVTNIALVLCFAFAVYVSVDIKNTQNRMIYTLDKVLEMEDHYRLKREHTQSILDDYAKAIEEAAEERDSTF